MSLLAESMHLDTSAGHPLHSCWYSQSSENFEQFGPMSIEELAAQIADAPNSEIVFEWTSQRMCCLKQTPANCMYEAPLLSIGFPKG